MIIKINKRFENWVDDVDDILENTGFSSNSIKADLENVLSVAIRQKFEHAQNDQRTENEIISFLLSFNDYIHCRYPDWKLDEYKLKNYRSNCATNCIEIIKHEYTYKFNPEDLSVEFFDNCDKIFTYFRSAMDAEITDEYSICVRALIWVEQHGYDLPNKLFEYGYPIIRE